MLLGGRVKTRERQIILKTDQRNILLEMGREGKFTAKSSSWDENRVFLEDDKREVAVKKGRWVDPSARWAAAGTTASRTLLPDGVGGASP